jgi:type IV pilus assembly protein PilF
VNSFCTTSARLAPLLLMLGLTLTACSTAETRSHNAENAKLVSIHTQLAAGHLIRNQTEFALQEAKQALAINPDDSQANSVMALVQQRMRNDEKTEMYFQRAIENDANNSEAQNNFAVFLCEHGRVQAAIEHFDSAISNPLYRSPEKANLNAGMCLQQRPVAGLSAVKYFRNALTVNPRSSIALYNLALISFEAGEALSARGFMQRFFETAQDSPESLLLAYKIEKALGARDTQANYAFRLRGKFPNSEEARQLAKITGR